MVNKTVCKFRYKFKKYEIDMLTETKWGNEIFVFDIFDVTDKSLFIGKFETHYRDDYKKLAKEILDKFAKLESSEVKNNGR